ncbi:MAG: hypothetical protein VKJ44_10910 [Synechococcus sp.]|nr:hypothetical protein [Synechococcus sp.]
MKRLAFALALGPLILSSMTACTNPSGTGAISTATPPIQDQGGIIADPVLSVCATSAASRRVAALLDQGSYNTATGLFHKLLSDHPEDARLHVEYVRYLLLSSDLAYSGNIDTPILRDGRYWAAGVAQEAGKRATQLDPDCRDQLADAIHTTLLSRIGQALDKNKGIIGEPGGFFYPRPNAAAMETGFASSMINLGWLALEVSPRRSRSFLDRYRQRMEQAIAKGKVATAAMLGNLLGDLEKGDLSGDLDFAYACDAFARSLANFQPSQDSDWIAHTIHIFQDIFKPDLQQAGPASGPEPLIRLRQELHSRGYTLLANSGPDYGLPEGPTGTAPGQP